MTTYHDADPRARLASDGGTASAVKTPAQFFCFGDLAPQETTDDGNTWYVRGQNFVLALSRVRAGWAAARPNQPDEYVVLLPDRASSAHVEANGERLQVGGLELVVVPPGSSRLTVEGNDCYVVRLFSICSTELAALSLNAAAYREPHTDVAPFDPWPKSPAGYRLRRYSLDVVRDDQLRFGRIFRCSTLMVNYLYPTIGPRDTKRMSPHTHPDFEQASLALEGEYFHHLRFPWGVDMDTWLPDDHVFCPAPSLAIIPPGAIHTSQAVGAGVNQLVDIFCPPRTDFSKQANWVLNADEYPMPD